MNRMLIASSFLVMSINFEMHALIFSQAFYIWIEYFVSFIGDENSGIECHYLNQPCIPLRLIHIFQNTLVIWCIIAKLQRQILLPTVMCCLRRIAFYRCEHES